MKTRGRARRYIPGFKVRTSRFLFILVIQDKEKADKLKASLSPGLQARTSRFLFILVIQDKQKADKLKASFPPGLQDLQPAGWQQIGKDGGLATYIDVDIIESVATVYHLSTEERNLRRL
ncbi:hypothetical protein PRIPAC_95781 [Pristionchus pacificus]|uniref:Large ribosomal subunit protein eL38 n=1 Tax=Pristionchus pacificus TaxID=54126 RepID=A0A2A6B2R2_PRIPA|nr:hypothetical protein PRIPAC_95781 [Pristionchus pacificus]|eukprot:PDM60165.1 hypothetical protein PRIPAC_53990 [Pristionchus pacificus]